MSDIGDDDADNVAKTVTKTTAMTTKMTAMMLAIMNIYEDGENDDDGFCVMVRLDPPVGDGYLHWGNCRICYDMLDAYNDDDDVDSNNGDVDNGQDNCNSCYDNDKVNDY